MSKVYWSLEEGNLLMDAAVKLVRENEKDCEYVLVLMEKAQRAALAPDRQRDVNTIDRKTVDSFWTRAHDRAARETALAFSHSKEVTELRQQLEKPMKIFTLLTCLAQELGKEWKTQIDGRLLAIETSLETRSEAL